MADLVGEAGALGAELQTGATGHLEAHLYFTGEHDPVRLAAELVQRCRAHGWPAVPKLDAELDGDWVEQYQRRLRPFDVGQRLRILPDGDLPQSCESAGRLAIALPPGRAFGTGDHATTVLCLEYLEARVRSGMHVLDVGTGTGILAIAAVRLGAARVVAVEPDREACAVATRNLRRNRVGGRVTLVVGTTAQVATGGFDLLCANLLASTLEDGMADLACLLRPGGAGVLCGIRPGDEEDRVSMAGWRRGLEPERFGCRDDWVALEVRKPLTPGPPEGGGPGA